jgi:uncharacterized protein YjbI with pentapeptide repeats
VALLILLIVVLVLFGFVLWMPRRSEPEARSDLGVALLTGAAISLVFFALQNENEDSRQEVADRQALQISLGLQRDLRGADLRDQPLHKFDLAFKDMSHANLRGVDLSKANLTNAILRGTRLDGANLEKADLSRADLTEAVLNGANLRDATLTDAILEGAEIGVDEFGKPADLTRAEAIDARMHHACLADAKLNEAILGGADLRDAVLTGANLKDAILERDGVPANLDGAAIAEVKADGVGVMTRSRPPVMGADPEREPMPAKAVADRIVEVSDGDTIELAELGWVRLLGIDAPGVNDGGPGQEGAGFVKEQVKRNANVRYQLGHQTQEQRRDGIGRYRAYVWLADGRFLNASLLEAGYVRRVPHADETREGHVTALTQAQYRAREQGRRIWSKCGTE